MKEFFRKLLNDKKKLIIMVVFLILIIVCIVLLCTKIIFKKNPDDIISPEDPTVKQFEEYLSDSIKGFDEDTIKDFISSTDSSSNVSELYWGFMYSGSIDTDIKTMYALSRLFYDDSDLINFMTGADMFDSDTELGEVKLSIKFINKVLKAKFVDTKIEANDLFSEFYNGIYDVVCDEENCTITIGKDKTTDSISDGVYSMFDNSFDKTSDGYTYTTKYAYYEIEFGDDLSFGLYSNALKDTKYCEGSILDIYASGLEIPDECGTEVNFTTLKYNFDKNYKFIDVEQA